MFVLMTSGKRELHKHCTFLSFSITSRYTIKFTQHMKLIFIMNSDTLICIWILVIPIGIFEVSNNWKLFYLLYFSSIHDYWPPNTWNYFEHTSWSEIERCEYAKNEHQLKHKSKCVTDVLLRVGSSSMTDKNSH